MTLQPWPHINNILLLKPTYYASKMYQLSIKNNYTFAELNQAYALINNKVDEQNALISKRQADNAMLI